MDYYKLICERRSNRDFEDDAVSEEQLAALRAYFADAMRLRPSIGVEIVLASPDVQVFAGQTGYTGVLVRAPHYLVLLSDAAEGDAENAGFLGSDLTLQLTDMGLDHCWLTVRDEEGVRRAFGIDSTRHVAGVIAFGHGRREGSSFWLDIKSVANVDVVRREGHIAPKIGVNELVFHEKWGEPEYVSDIDDTIDLKMAFLAASMAPSYLNRQPYRLIWDGGRVVLVLRADEMTNPYDARLNAGIVMHHISAVLSQYRPQAPTWTLGAPQKDYGVPQDCTIAAYCDA